MYLRKLPNCRIDGNFGSINAAANSNNSENRGSSTPLTPSVESARFPSTPGSTNAGGAAAASGINNSGGAQAGATFPIPSSPQTPSAGTD